MFATIVGWVGHESLRTLLPLPPSARAEALHRLRSLTSKPIERLVPTARRQILRFKAGSRSATLQAISDATSHRQKTRYTLPFVGEWYVLKGGVDRNTSHSWEVVS